MSTTSNDVRGLETRISYQLIRNVTSPEEKDNGIQTYVANIPATELKKLGTEDNLRTYIPEHSAKRRNAVHKAIERTIVEEPTRFINRNSGVTIACARANVNDSNNLITMIGASIINGAQTQGEILRYLAEIEDDENDKTEPTFNVRAEIIVDPEHSSIVETAIARNTATRVQDISQAGARGHLNDLRDVMKAQLGLNIRMSETDTDVVETMQVLQYARLLMPATVSGNTSASELLRPYKNRAQCLEDFSEWWSLKDKGTPAERAAAQARYDFVIQMAPVAWREYTYWESHDGWNNKYIWEQTQKGGRVVRRDKKNKIVWVSPGIVFPLMKSMSAFVAQDASGHWRLDKPSLFKADDMISRAVAQFRAHDSNPMDMGRSDGAYQALLIYPETIVQVMKSAGK